jgi:hypothetical protein
VLIAAAIELEFSTQRSFIHRLLLYGKERSFNMRRISVRSDIRQLPLRFVAISCAVCLSSQIRQIVSQLGFSYDGEQVVEIKVVTCHY